MFNKPGYVILMGTLTQHPGPIYFMSMVVLHQILIHCFYTQDEVYQGLHERNKHGGAM